MPCSASRSRPASCVTRRPVSFAENYGRELQVGEVRVHPFKLQLEVRDLALPDTDARTMLGFARLFVDFELSSLWERAFVFKDVTLEAPVARAVVRPDGSLNLGDLALPEDPEDADAPLPSVWIQSLAVERGTVTFVDSCAHDAVRAHVRNRWASGCRTSARRRRAATFDFTARSRGRRDVRLAGPLRTRAADRLAGRVPDRRPASARGRGVPRRRRCPSSSPTARSTSRAPTGLARRTAGTGPASCRRSSWRNSACARAARTRTGSGFRRLSLSDTAVAMPAQSVTLGKVAIAGLQAQAWMSPDGTVNLQQLFATTAPAC